MDQSNGSSAPDSPELDYSNLDHGQILCREIFGFEVPPVPAGHIRYYAPMSRTDFLKGFDPATMTFNQRAVEPDLEKGPLIQYEDAYELKHALWLAVRSPEDGQNPVLLSGPHPRNRILHWGSDVDGYRHWPVEHIVAVDRIFEVVPDYEDAIDIFDVTEEILIN